MISKILGIKNTVKVFDVDGVIIDSQKVFEWWVRYFCETLENPQTDEIYRKAAADHNSPHWLFPWNEKAIKEAYKLFAEYTAEEKNPEIFNLIPGTKETLLSLLENNEPISFFTSKSKIAFELVFKYHKLDDLLKNSFSITKDCIKNKKPNPDWLFLISEKLNRWINELVFFWDSHSDFESAKNAWIEDKFIWVRSGVNTWNCWDELWVKHIESINEIKKYI